MNEIEIRSFADRNGELKLDWGPGYRIYFGQDGHAIVILLAGGTQQRRGEDIATARTRWAEYKERKTLRRG